MKLRPGLILEARDVTQFRNIFLLVVCVKTNLRVSVAVLSHVLYGCETRFLSKTGQMFIQGEDICLHGRRRHNVKFGVSRVLENVKGTRKGKKLHNVDFKMCTFHQIPPESNRICYGMGWGEHVAVRSDTFV